MGKSTTMDSIALEGQGAPVSVAVDGSTHLGVKSILPSKLIPITTKTIAVVGTIDDAGSTSSSAYSPDSTSPTTPQATSSAQPLSPISTNGIPTLCDHDEASAGTVTAVLHKKDSGTSMNSSTTSASDNEATAAVDPVITAQHNGKSASITRNKSNGAAKSGNPVKPSVPRRLSQPEAASAGFQSFPTITPTGRVLSRPLSTSKLSATPMVAPHILPNQQRHAAGFNLATLGQLSPTASAAATATSMTMSRAETLAFLSSNSNNSYFTANAGSSRSSHHGDIHGLGLANLQQQHHVDGGMTLPSGGTRTMCGSDAISLLDLDDPHNDLVMIDSNGNSSGSGVTGVAVVGETMASASAIVANGHHSGNHHHGVGGTLAAGLTLTASASSALLRGSRGGESAAISANGSGNGGESHAGTFSAASTNLPQRSSLPTLTSQAKKDAMQRAAMIAAMQQNGGAKVLAAQRVGRRQDRPSRNIRFGEFHRICEIEYGFDQGRLYLFSDVLVTGTRMRRRVSEPVQGSTRNTSGVSDKQICSAISDSIQGEPKGESASDVPVPGKEYSTGNIKEQGHVSESVQGAVQDNPYAGHLENQRISRLTQVQADIVENDERPLLKIAAPQLSLILLFGSTAARDSFLALLNETTAAHKHHLLFQSKYLADLKKFKRHSAFSFDTSFLKTWGIPGSLNLGSIKPTGGSHGNGAIGPSGTFTTSPLTSPGGGAFDPYQYQQYLNRPQSMAGSLFNFALNGGSFPSFSDHSKESSYATLRGANAANTLQYHHQQQQMLQQQLQNRLSMSSTGSVRPGMDRTSSGSAFDGLWFMKGGDHSKTRKTALEAVAAPTVGGEEKAKAGEDDSEEGSASSSVQSSSSGTNLSAIATKTNSNSHGSAQNTNRFSSSSTLSILPSTPASNCAMGTLRKGAGWVRDEDATVCMVCSTTKFGVLVRKHHCRLCGRVICWKCCQMKDVVIQDPFSSTELSDAIPQELRKPIRVCLDCIEHDAAQENQQQNRQQSPPQLFPLRGVLGKLMSSTSTSSHLATSATNALGSILTMPQAQTQIQSPLSPRVMKHGRTGHPYPHHHRASLYRIDVERVGEEDEEEEEEEQDMALKDKGNVEDRHGHDESQEHESHDPRNSSAIPSAESTLEEPTDPLREIIRSNPGTIRLKDLDPADINEDEVNTQIMTLESEVESLLIQGAGPMMFVNTGTKSRGGKGSGGVSSSMASKTRVLRGIPKELLQGAEGLEARIDGGDDEKTMEELLAEQDEQVRRILAR
ncbi:hypothetical protein BGZ54_007602 [Gamsiella multidivaricata]|nr:hypothetical protein BGZ54_007602 [Gamsiella multidivaricata]